MNKRLLEIRGRKEEIRNELQGDGKVDLKALQEELRALNEEQAEIEKREEIANKINNGMTENVHKREKPEGKVMKNKMGMYDTDEYRHAFMDYVCRGVAIPAEYRDNAVTATGDVGAIIPPATLNKVVDKLENYGMILPLVTKTNYAQGVSIPVSEVKPVATWVAEGATSETQKKTVGSVVFAHHKLRCAVAVTLETEYMSYSAFEAAIVSNMAEAMAMALEEAIIAGDGNGKPTGILNDKTKGTTITASALTYDTLINAEAALPSAYENGSVWVMTKQTFMKFVGMTDANGQPIARVNYGVNGVPVRTLLGRTVVITNAEYMKSFGGTLADGDVFAFIYKMSDYILNTNFAITMKQYEDNETDDIVRKSIMVCDGKPVDTNSLVMVAYKAAA